MNWKTIRATHLKMNFQELYSQPKEVAEEFLKKWYFLGNSQSYSTNDRRGQEYQASLGRGPALV